METMQRRETWGQLLAVSEISLYISFDTLLFQCFKYWYVKWLQKITGKGRKRLCSNLGRPKVRHRTWNQMIAACIEEKNNSFLFRMVFSYLCHKWRYTVIKNMCIKTRFFASLKSVQTFWYQIGYPFDVSCITESGLLNAPEYCSSTAAGVKDLWQALKHKRLEIQFVYWKLTLGHIAVTPADAITRFTFFLLTSCYDLARTHDE